MERKYFFKFILPAISVFFSAQSFAECNDYINNPGKVVSILAGDEGLSAEYDNSLEFYLDIDGNAHYFKTQKQLNTLTGAVEYQLLQTAMITSAYVKVTRCTAGGRVVGLSLISPEQGLVHDTPEKK